MTPAAGALALLLAVTAPALVAQQAVNVAGTVVERGSGTPIPGAILTLGETGRQAISDARGRFSLVRAPVGTHELRAQRIGYQELAIRVTVEDGMTPLELEMEPAPIALDEITVTGDARGDVGGIVIDAGSGLPVGFTDLTLTRGGVDRVGRSVASDDRGEFAISDIEVGEYLLRVERIGYHPQFVQVSHAVPPLPIEVRLEADSAMLRGLAVMNGELNLRRNAHGRSVLTFDETKLRLAARTGMKRFFDAYLQHPIVECGDPPRRTCIQFRGSATRPVVYIDGFRVMDVPPPPPPPPPIPPGARGGRPPPPPPLPEAPVALDVLDSYAPNDVYKLEYFECAGGMRDQPKAAFSGNLPVLGYIEIHVYTHAYMERLARDPKVPGPVCIP